MNAGTREGTFRLCCPLCGFEAPPFDYDYDEAQNARKNFSPSDCPGCGEPIDTLAVIPSEAAELSWDNIEKHWGITLGESQHTGSDADPEGDNA